MDFRGKLTASFSCDAVGVQNGVAVGLAASVVKALRVFLGRKYPDRDCGDVPR